MCFNKHDLFVSTKMICVFRQIWFVCLTNMICVFWQLWFMCFDRYDLCVSFATRSDVILRSGRLFAPPRKAADAVSNKYPIKMCLQFILTCTALSQNCRLIRGAAKFQNHASSIVISQQLFGSRLNINMNINMDLCPLLGRYPDLKRFKSFWRFHVGCF